MYSTCTFAPEEDEQVIRFLLEACPEFQLLPIGEDRPSLFSNGHPEWAKDEAGTEREELALCARIWPHRQPGEGHFLALLVRQGEDVETCATSSGLPQADAVRMRALQAFACGEHPVRVHMLGETLVSLPEACPALRGIRVLRAGLHLGQVRGKLFFPDHAWALSVQPPECPRVALTQEEAMAYQAGEELPAEGTGYVLPTFEGLPLGWGKVSNGRMKNHYPKGLRRTLR